MFELSALHRAVSEREPLEHWRERIPAIADERAAVEAFIAGGGQAYGFTTLFGHLDSIQRERDGIANLYRGHLVGNPERVPPQIARGILAVKLCQLSNGGTGISPSTYAVLLDQFDRDLDDVRIDLAASYGSGDVVPGAWFTDAMFGGVDALSSGDFMALINGSYIAAGVLLGEYERVERAFSDGLDLVAQAADFAAARKGTVQLPVSLRDIYPVQQAVAVGQDALHEAIEQAINRRSSNPLFDENGQPLSNSSFLDFPLALAAQTATEAARILSSYLTAATRWVCKVGEEEADQLAKPLYVQLPKVSKGYNDGISSRAVVYSQGESLGVEDISDGGLIATRGFLGCLTTIEKQTELLRQALYSARATCSAMNREPSREG